MWNVCVDRMHMLLLPHAHVKSEARRRTTAQRRKSSAQATNSLFKRKGKKIHIQRHCPTFHTICLGPSQREWLFHQSFISFYSVYDTAVLDCYICRISYYKLITRRLLVPLIYIVTSFMQFLQRYCSGALLVH